MHTDSMSRVSRLVALALFLAAAADAMAIGPKAYVGNFQDNTVSVIDTATGDVVATVPVAAGPHGMGISRDGRWVYVTGDESSSMSIIDTATDRVARTVEVGKSPHGVALAPDGKMLLVTVNGDSGIAFVDTARQAVIGTVAVPKPHTIAFRPDGKLAYVASQEPGHFALVVLDPEKRAIVRSVALNQPPRDLEFSHDGKSLFFTLAGVNAVQVLESASDKIVGEVTTGASPHYANWFPHTTVGMAVVQGPGELLLFDPATHKALKSVKVGKQPHWMTVSGDGKTAFVTNEGSNDVSVVDLATGNTRTVNVGKAPRKIVVQSAAVGASGANISIVNFAFSPGEMRIGAGERLTWSNNDGAPHAVAFKDNSTGTKSILPGQTFSRLFDRAGTFDYFCSVHPYMTGRVVVGTQSGAHAETATMKRHGGG
jgi:YVTN family beta-propeller protein